jgi:hypothetical protein
MLSVLSSWRHGIARTASHQDESPAEYGREAVTASQRFLDELHSCSARLCFPCRPSFSTETIPFATIFSERLTVTCWLCLNSRRSSGRFRIGLASVERNSETFARFLYKSST